MPHCNGNAFFCADEFGVAMYKTVYVYVYNTVMLANMLFREGKREKGVGDTKSGE